MHAIFQNHKINSSEIYASGSISIYLSFALKNGLTSGFIFANLFSKFFLWHYFPSGAYTTIILNIFIIVVTSHGIEGLIVPDEENKEERKIYCEGL